MNTVRTSILSLALLLSSGCATMEAVREDYVAADRATYDAVAPRYLEYVQGDDSLGPDEKKRRERTINTWRLRLEQAETPVQPAPEGE